MNEKRLGLMLSSCLSKQLERVDLSNELHGVIAVVAIFLQTPQFVAIYCCNVRYTCVGVCRCVCGVMCVCVCVAVCVLFTFVGGAVCRWCGLWGVVCVCVCVHVCV